LFLNTCQKVINGVGWLDDRHGLSPLFVYTDQLLWHCYFIRSNVRKWLVYCMRWLLWCFCLLAKSYETINHYHYHSALLVQQVSQQQEEKMNSKNIFTIRSSEDPFKEDHCSETFLNVLRTRKPFSKNANKKRENKASCFSRPAHRSYCADLPIAAIVPTCPSQTRAQQHLVPHVENDVIIVFRTLVFRNLLHNSKRLWRQNTRLCKT